MELQRPPRPRRHRRPRTGILCVHSSNEMYGADRVLLQVVQALPPDRRDDVVVWLPDGRTAPGTARLDRELKRAGYAARSLPLPVLRRSLMSVRGFVILLGQAAAVLPALARLRPQVLHCSTSAALLLAPAARMLGVPRVVLHIQEIWSGPEALVLRFLAGFATDWIAISRASAASMRAGMRHRVQVIPNGVEDRPMGEPPPEREREGPLRFVMAGRWNAWKGHRTLLEAWDGAEPPGTLSILGGPPSSGNAADVAGMVAGLRWPGSVTIVGEVPDITPYIDAADVMVVPSASPEPFGLVAIEAFARSRPVVGSNAGGLADVVTHGVTGWLFRPGDAAELSAVLRGLDRTRTEAVGRLARHAYEEQYTAAIFQENLRTWWKGVLEA